MADKWKNQYNLNKIALPLARVTSKMSNAGLFLQAPFLNNQLKVMLYFTKGGHLIKFFKSFDSLFILAITLLFVYDYFPNVPFADAIPKGVLVLLILGALLFRFVFKKNTPSDLKTNFKWQVVLILYILILMVVFPLLGGESASGIAFDNEFVWVIVFISIFDIYSQWKRAKRSEA